MNDATQPRERSFREGSLSERSRSWVVAGMAFCLVIIFLAVWVTYAGAHTYERFEQLPPGASSTIDDTTYRVVALRQTETVTDGEETHPAAAGAIWVVAEVEVTIPRKMETVPCSLLLVSDDRRAWEPQTSFYNRKLPQYCGDYDHPITPKKPWRLEQVFEVPARFKDRIYGLATPDPASSAPTKVLRPA
ncbi:hypothetical protein [Microlunatus soli]|uniref:DUF4352 domain-containing protein n=1 Tax=Microlunatus soli TaxID=630515 RepID=A0A1H1UIC5_9ACTN|nr:hypothetical protein [Microlunatus soli]SDS72228.1 hypothetical protein SAMN04489812_2802 [Microlunatus soli]